MRNSLLCILIISTFLFTACSQDDVNEAPTPTDAYFPPLDNSTWETQSPESLGWDMDVLNDLSEFLENNDSRAFLILKNGRIVVEKYYGDNIMETSDFDQNSQWYWASAGKSLASVLVGIAQMDNKLNINNPTSDYLGDGWSSLSAEQENQITVRNHLSMTTGLDYQVPDLNCRTPECLDYNAPPGTEWYYYNAPYLLTHNIIENATNKSLEEYSQEKIYDPIGMKGRWREGASSKVHWSTARDMARFGLLVANDGNWNGEQIYEGDYFDQMIKSSQNLNSSYGFLWWLNGKENVIYPSSTITFPGPIIPEAPADMFSALGKDGQILDIVRSNDLIVVRLGDSDRDDLVATQLSRKIWTYLKDAMPEQ